MASKTFLLLALALAVVLLITSEIAAAEDVASNHDSQVDGRGGYNSPHGGYNVHGHDGHHYGGGRGRHGGGRRGGCRYGCCGRGNYGGGCRCCATFAEAAAYKQTQN
ncbi:hypothetical protein QVD17_19286 [Tagetes erecta]|uniref:Glycine-rich protein n=1 Tax=Tagetes erecta TaxID=13708 RepID=A0AAD8NPX2_TARER|nr:hypothetical protein QVD17_19286 [Tagetes erecta]